MRYRQASPAYHLGAAALAAFFIPAAAHGAAICGQRANLVAALGNDFQEAPSFEAVTLDGRLMEILVAPEGETWTVLLTSPDGLTCVVAAGTAFEALKRPASKPGGEES